MSVSIIRDGWGLAVAPPRGVVTDVADVGVVDREGSPCLDHTPLISAPPTNPYECTSP